MKIRTSALPKIGSAKVRNFHTPKNHKIQMDLPVVVPQTFDVLDPALGPNRVKVSIFKHWQSVMMVNRRCISFATMAQQDDLARVIIRMKDAHSEVEISRIIEIYEK